MLKVGDKLLCKITNFFVDKYYTIKIINKFDNSVIFRIKNENDDFFTFSLNKNDNYYIWKYFYTPNEVRKMKLKKLKHVKSW